MASGLDQLSKLMALKSQMDMGKARNASALAAQQKFQYQQGRDQVADKHWQQTYDLNKLTKEAMESDKRILRKKKIDETAFNEVSNTNLPNLIQAYEDDRSGFGIEAGALAADHPNGAPTDFLKTAMDKYDATYGKTSNGGRGVTIQHIEDPNRPGYTKAVYITPDGEEKFYNTVPTASTQLTQDPTNRGNIATSVKSAENDASTLKGIRDGAWEGYEKAYASDQQVNQSEELIKTWKPGPGSSFRQLMDSVVPFFGGKADASLSDKQFFDALTGRDMLAARNPKGEIGGLTGATSDKDVELLRSLVANAGMTPEAIQLVLGFQREANARKRAMFKIVNDYKGTDPRELKKQLAKYKDDNPYSIYSAKTVGGNLSDVSDDDLLNF